MGAEISVCPLCHTPRMPRRKGDAWFWGCQNYPTCTGPTTTTPPAPQNLKTLLKQRTQAVNDRIPAKGCRHLLVKPWAHGRRKGSTCQLCGAIINDKGEITGTSKSVDPEETGDRRGEASFQPDGGGTHGAGSGAGRGTRNQPVNEDRPEEAFAGRHQEDKRLVGKMV